MSTLVFVRHGQASLFADDYDQLSEAGELQSRELGRYLERTGVVFDEVYCGPRKRQRDTARLAREESGRLPIASTVPEFDEHHVDQLLSSHLDELATQFPHLSQLRNRFHIAESPTDRQRAFARLFESVSVLWVTDSCPMFGIESWAEFRQRVNSGIERILSRGGRGRKVLVVTSAGTIVAAMHRALQCPDEVALGLGWRVWNCSLTAFAFTKDRFTLDRFNSMSHLDDPDLWTYR
ncbi:MAG: histidine phosphatase family protein [Planctomycetaceae bacterium]|jgi:broad specificity phosphatase PhoE